MNIRAEQLPPCPHCGGNIETELNCSICRLIFGTAKTFRSEDWVRRTPGPATAKLIRCIKAGLEPTDKMLDAFLAEWADPATPPAHEQPRPSLPWTCAVCGEPVRIDDDLTPFHCLDVVHNHDAELSDAVLRTLLRSMT